MNDPPTALIFFQIVGTSPYQYKNTALPSAVHFYQYSAPILRCLHVPTKFYAMGG